MKCDDCGYEKQIKLSVAQASGSLDLNLRLITACRAVGIGLSQLRMLLALLDMPCEFSKYMYNKLLKDVGSATASVAEESMNRAAAEIAVVKKKERRDYVDCTVMMDGTWHKRGHSSLHGVVSSISMDVGKVVDVECLTRVCRACDKRKGLKKSSTEYQEWYEKHEKFCKCNFSGSAPSMESFGVSNMFHRSIEKRKLRYAALISDGDSTSYKSL